MIKVKRRLLLKSALAAPAIIAFNRFAWGATTVWIPSALPLNGPSTGMGGASSRDTASSLSSASLGQVRASFKNSTVAGNIVMDHVSIGVASTAPNTAATPVELKFSGSSGYSCGFNVTVTSDWSNLTWAISDTLIFVQDFNAGTDGAGFGIGLTNGDEYRKAATASYNQASVSGFSETATLSFMCILIETQVGASSTGKNILMNGI